MGVYGTRSKKRKQTDRNMSEDRALTSTNATLKTSEAATAKHSAEKDSKSSEMKDNTQSQNQTLEAIEAAAAAKKMLIPGEPNSKIYEARGSTQPHNKTLKSSETADAAKKHRSGQTDSNGSKARGSTQSKNETLKASEATATVNHQKPPVEKSKIVLATTNNMLCYPSRVNDPMAHPILTGPTVNMEAIERACAAAGYRSKEVHLASIARAHATTGHTSNIAKLVAASSNALPIPTVLMTNRDAIARARAKAGYTLPADLTD